MACQRARDCLAFLLLFAATGYAFPPPAAPLPPREAAAAMKVPDGFKVTLFAGEPDVVQPIAMCFDDRGRLWVAECHTYPGWIKDGKPGRDRILVFEDTNNDGVFDKRTVVLDKLANLTSIEFGFGGIYALTAPNLIHVPIDKDDRPGEPKILLDGWSLDTRHNIVNGLKWGPDGWLYGCHGILATSRVGTPATPKDKRPPINCGIWRFHPVTHKYEVVCHGGTNPWGIDWDEQGELYFTNCVIDHAFHVVPGGHYQRMFGNDFNPHLYKLMGSCVDHLHWGGGAWTDSRSGGKAGGLVKHSEAGGGHAHSGCMIYLGDNFPKEYRNSLFTGNIHGNRINRDRIDYTNKGPVLRHEKDFLFGNDPWFRPLAITYGPDGGVYVIDWTDTGECHNFDKAHKTSGRIYKIVYGEKKLKAVDLSKATPTELMAWFYEPNGWAWRHAQRRLRERCLADPSFSLGSVLAEMARLKRRGPDTRGGNRRAWQTLLMTERRNRNGSDLWPLLEDDDIAHVVLTHLVRERLQEPEVMRNPNVIESLVRCADNGDPTTRRLLASGLQKLPIGDRVRLAEALLQRIEDDANVSLLVWYGIEPLPAVDLDASIALLKKSRSPMVREFMARRIASLPKEKGEAGIDALLLASATPRDTELERSVFRGLEKALEGRTSAPMPKCWPTVFPHFQKSPLAEVRDRSCVVGVVFGDRAAFDQLVANVKNRQNDVERRRNGLKVLVGKRPEAVKGLLDELLGDDDLRSAAIKELAKFDDGQIPPRLLKLYPGFSAAGRADVVATLSSRPPFALALLDAVAAKTVDRKDLGPVEVRQLLALKDKTVTARVEDVWGSVRPAAKDKVAQIAKYKKLLAADQIENADPVLGRQIYVKHCAACHKLFGEGGTIGPDITGSQRGNLDYLLENILDPSAVVPREYQVTIFTTKAGRTITGLVKEETDATVSVQTQNETLVLPKADIEQRTATRQSMMPDGILEQMSLGEARALAAFLRRETPLQKR